MPTAVEDDPLLAALSRLVAGEERPEAGRTAAALAAAPPGALAATQPPTAFDDAIRALLAGAPHPVASVILAAQERIPWGTNPVADRVGAGFTLTCAVATLLGPEGPVHSPDFRLGLFYQRPASYYALHAHLADETYWVLAGHARWTAGTSRLDATPGTLIHHPSLMPHAFRTGPDGLLALWRWSGDIGVSSYAMLDDPEAHA